MKLVDSGEAVAYGIHLLSYLAGLAIVGWIASITTMWLIRDGNTLFALLLGFLGTLIILGGLLGLSYKVISDAVATGLTNRG